jgi:hypothetical protein
MQVEMAHFAAVNEEHKVLKARFTKGTMALAHKDGDEKEKETVDPSKTVKQETDSSVKEGMAEVSVAIPSEKEANVPADATIVASPTTGV